MKNVAITTDYIVAFGNETDKQFADSIKHLKQLKFANMNVFIYSRRKGTVADKLYKKDINPIIARITNKTLIIIAVVIFSLEDAEPMTLQKTVFDDGTESIAYTLYNSYFLDHFGKDIYDDAYSNRLYLMDIFNKWNLKSEVELVEDEEEWLVTAKSTVAHYIELLKERRNTK